MVFNKYDEMMDLLGKYEHSINTINHFQYSIPFFVAMYTTHLSCINNVLIMY